MKFDSVFWFLKKGKEKERIWEGERLSGLFKYVSDVEAEKLKAVPILEGDFKEILRTAEKNFEWFLKTHWKGIFSCSPFHEEEVSFETPTVRTYQVKYGINKDEKGVYLRFKATSQSQDQLVFEKFDEQLVDFIDPEYNERGKFYGRSGDRIEMVIDFFPPTFLKGKL